ncbi:hypothetical protein L1987_84375 [Smallanthus sonchifolius]|uniref:Uncharacterized protein n=1 Tax=Smallanthus sonchifolius TaxID=185202 RepID=A0ACB8YFQ4_9ASTR|nr:hypothetical protein L1987_84375 [Smallanthus sonchifolius]
MEFTTFPQPTRPSSYSNLTSFKYSTAISQDSEPSTSTSNYRQQPDVDDDELFGELTRILFDCLEHMDNVTKGLVLRKVFSELEKESKMENFIVEKLKCSQVKVISDFLERYPKSSIGEDEVEYDPPETVSRGFNEDLLETSATGGSKATSSHKLERFKVKTINIEAGVIKK